MITLDVIDRIFDLADTQFKEQKDFAQAIGFYPSKVSEWRTRKSKSYQKRLPQIAEVLGTTVDYLLTGKKNEPTTVSDDGPTDEDLIRLWKSLSPDEILRVKDFVQGMIANRKDPPSPPG